MDGPPPTNDLIASLVARLSPEALEILGFVEEMARDAPEDEGMDHERALELAGTLPEDDQLILARIVELRARAGADVADGIRADLERGEDAPG